MTKTRSRGRPAHGDILTPGEWRVAEGVRHGLTNRAIAERQGVSVDAVKFHVANILAKLNLAGRRELRRWTGVRADSNLAGAGPARGTDRLGAIGQISRAVGDVEAARRWYADVLGLPHLYSHGPLAFFDCDGTRLMLSEGEGAANSILYFRVADIHAACERLGARGISFLGAPHLIHRHEDGTEEWMAFFHDPEGRTLALMAQVPLSSIPSSEEES